MTMRNHPWLYLAKPNIGQPQLRFADELNAEVTLLFAVKTDWSPTMQECHSWISNDSLMLRHKSLSQIPLRYKRVTHIKQLKQNDDPPQSSIDYQYKAGFRWEFEVRFSVNLDQLATDAHLMFDIVHRQRYWNNEKQEWKIGTRVNHNSLYVDKRYSTDIEQFTLIHVTDLHVARRNDAILEILSEIRDAQECRELAKRYVNFNDNLREVIKYANAAARRGELIVLVAGGDLVDYYHDGCFSWNKAKAQKDTSNFAKFVEIIAGLDDRDESLECPLFTILGNHDYLLHEPPLCWNIMLGDLKVRDRDSFKKFGLKVNEGREYDCWWRGEQEKERRIQIKEHGGHDTELSEKDSYDIGWPHYSHLVTYLERINFDTDFVVNIGPHRMVCLNTGPDRYPNKGQLVWDAIGGSTSDYVQDYLNEGPHTEGITSYGKGLVGNQLRYAKGLVFCFTHAPLVNFHKDQREGIQVLFEENHSQMAAPPNSVTDWLIEKLPGKMLKPMVLPNARESQAKYLRDEKGYTQAHTPYFKRGKRDANLNFQSADGKVDEFLWEITRGRTLDKPTGSRPGRPIPRKLAVLFSGHTHKVHEFRIRAGNDKDDLLFHVDNYSGSNLAEYGYDEGISTIHSLSSAIDKEAWLEEHAPLLLTSGTLKRGYPPEEKEHPAFRRIVVEGRRSIESMQMISLSKPKSHLEKRDMILQSLLLTIMVL